MKHRSINTIMVATFVFLLPFTPPYFSIGIGGDSFSLTARRVLILVFLLVIFLVKYTDAMKDTLSRSLKAPIPIIVYFFALIVSAFVGFSHGQGFYPGFKAIDIILSSVVGYSIGRILNNRDSYFVLKFAFMYPLIVILPIAIIEYTSGKNFYFDLLSNNQSANSVLSMNNFTRNGAIRAQATFFDPIDFSEYLIFCLLFILLLYPRRRVLRQFCIVTVLVFCALLAGSRYAYIMYSLVFIFWIWLNLLGRTNLVTPITIIGAVLLIVFGNSFITSYTESIKVTDFTTLMSDDIRSIVSRFQQLRITSEIWIENPLLGSGLTRNIPRRFDLVALDNFYLGIVIEGGLFLFLSYIFLLYYFGSTAIRLSHTRINDEFRRFAIGFISIYTIIKVFNSNDFSNIYLFIVIGMIQRRRELFNVRREIGKP